MKLLHAEHLSSKKHTWQAVTHQIHLDELDGAEGRRRPYVRGSEASSGVVLISVSGGYYLVLHKLRRKVLIRKSS